MKKAQINKTFLIILIVVVALLVLVWFFWGKQLVGQAIYAGVPETAGIVTNSLTINTQTNVSFVVGANIGTGQASGAAFSITLPDAISCDKVNVTNIMNSTPFEVIPELVIYNNATCENNTLNFIYFALDNQSEAMRSGKIDIAQVTIKDGFSCPGSYFFNLTQVELVNYTNFVNLVNQSLLQSITLNALGECSGAIKINFTSKEDGKSVTSLTKNKEYTIKADITPNINLSEHFVLVTVNQDNLQKAQFWQAFSNITPGNSEQVFFDYTAPQNGTLQVKVMVWKNPLVYNETWNELIPFAQKDLTVN
jgi:hypothetical protein